MNKKRENSAKLAADFIRSRFNLSEKMFAAGDPIALILGTGWGNALDLDLDSENEIPFSEIPGLEKIKKLKGHKRCFYYRRISGRPVVILRGRLHMNESQNDTKIAKMVRLQTEMLCQLGAKTIIATCAAGALDTTPFSEKDSSLKVGNIAVIDGFVSLYAGKLPYWGNEFYSPEDTINERLNKIALREKGELVAKEVGYAMFRGSNFEGRKYDKRILAASGAGVVGMSMLPEAAIAAIYNAKFLGLCFVTNDDKEIHSHEENIVRANKASSLLGDYLKRIISNI